MRRLKKRGKLPKAASDKLKKETEAIRTAAHQKAEAERRYKNARGANWFEPVLKALRELTGAGERCMF